MKKRVVLTSFITIAVLVVLVALLAIPGQFAKFGNNTYNGFETLFAFKFIDGKNYHVDNYGGRPSVAAIIAFVLIIFAIISCAFVKKSKALPFLAGVCLLIAGILMLTIKLSLAQIYHKGIELFWEPYVIGSVIFLLGAYLIYLEVIDLKNDKKEMAKPKSQQYSYLKSNNEKEN